MQLGSGFGAACASAGLDIGADDNGDGDARGSEDPPPELGAGSVDPPIAPLPWADFHGPSAAGYVYKDGHHTVRIQRPDDGGNRVWITCYQHPSCRANVGDRDGHPSNEEIFAWLFEVAKAERHMPLAQRKELARQHMTIARERWGVRGR